MACSVSASRSSAYWTAADQVLVIEQIAWNYMSELVPDCQHERQDMTDGLTHVSAIHAAQYHSEGRSMVLVRVPKHDEVNLTTALDAGAAGIIIPHCESAQEVEDFKKDVFFGKQYPFASSSQLLTMIGPIGQRSFSPWTFTPGLGTSLYEK
jgi:4-hydroxy-2-oxoheptanedioate aldolase